MRTLLALVCALPLATATLVTGGAQRQAALQPEPLAAVGVDAATGAQRQEPAPAPAAAAAAAGATAAADAAAGTGGAAPLDEAGGPDLSRWPRYPDGDPRGGEPIMPLVSAAVDDPSVVEAAGWAVGHLRGMSDSGVYTSLRLVSVDEAATQEGVFHNNTLLTLTLASPHLLDGAPTSTHRFIVMADLEDGVRSFAIDAFPVMDPDAIEEFWMRKVDAHR